jgi:hypothetical protein
MKSTELTVKSKECNNYCYRNFQGCERHDGGNTQPENHQPAGGAQGSQSEGTSKILVIIFIIGVADPDPDPHGSAWIRIDSGRLDPDPGGLNDPEK